MSNINTATLKEMGRVALEASYRTTQQESLDGIVRRLAHLIDEAEELNKLHSRARYGDGSLLVFIRDYMGEDHSVLVDPMELLSLNGLGVRESEVIHAINAYVGDPYVCRRLVVRRGYDGHPVDNDDRSLSAVRAVSAVNGIILAMQ